MLTAYLKRQWKLLLLLAGAVAVFAAVFALYSLPVEAVAYAGLLCLMLGLVLFALGYSAFLRRHRELEGLLRKVHESVLPLPPPRGVLEADYQALLRAVCADRVRLAAENRDRLEDMTDYYTLWAHQIKTPIAAARLLLQEDPGAVGTEVEVELLKIEQYVDMVLGYLRLDSESTDYVLRDTDLDGLLRQAVRKFARMFILKKITLDFRETGRTVLTDGKWLSFVVEQLLSNALKYTPTGGKISISVKTEASKVKIIVSDTGIGISPKEQKKLFTSFFRASNAISSGTPGIGLGLLQAKRFAALLKGDIKVSSVVNQGSEFTLILNRVIVTNSAISVTTPVMERSVTTESTMPCDPDKDTLLIVEDNDELRLYMRRIFEPVYRVVDKSNAQEALEYMETQYPSLVLSDIMMPGMQGDEMCHRIKSTPATSGIPVILLTAKTFRTSIIEGLQKGADDYIAKPFDIDILKAKIQAQIENRRRLRQYYTQIALQHTLSTDKTIKEMPVQSAVPNNADSAFVEKATQIVKDNISDFEFDIDRLCRHMAMCRTLFHERLKALTGHTPQDFIRIIRLEQAAALLQQGIPVTDVSIQTGFVNSKYFSTLFKKYFGVQPSRYTGQRMNIG